MELKDVLTREDLAVGSYRFAVSRMIPQMTKLALRTHKKDLMRETPNFAKRKFLYRLSRSGEYVLYITDLLLSCLQDDVAEEDKRS